MFYLVCYLKAILKIYFQLVSSGTYTKPLVLKGTSNSAHAGAITVS